jgi:hypothetical protein
VALNRPLTEIRNRYLKALKDFTFEGLAPPPVVVASGQLPAVEAVSQLITLHHDSVRRVEERVGGYQKTAARMGPDQLTAVLWEDLAAFYSLPVEEIAEGFAVHEDAAALYDRAAQPRLDTGQLDTSVLRAECDREFELARWVDPRAVVDVFATPHDPRLPLVRSRVSLRPEGLAWTSYYRPQNFQVALFDDLRLIRRQSGQWCLEFEDWRRRRIADPNDTPAFEAFLDQLRQLADDAGFTWDTPDEGRRDGDPGWVVYDLSSWPSERCSAATATLLDSVVPHEWEGRELRVPRDHEALVDQILGLREPGDPPE